MTNNTRSQWGLNFNSGPSILPKEVFQQASEAIINFRDTGLSILEIGHRTPLFQSVLDEAKALVLELLALDESYEVLFLHGGATMQFLQIPMNFLGANQTAGYIDAGTWGTKAIKEAERFGQVKVVSTSKDKGYTYINKNYDLPENAAYLHITSNNTIEGTQQFSWPKVDYPVFVDMSSDIFSRNLHFNQFDFIYAGAQKNIGAAGVTLVVIKKELLAKSQKALPTMMDYRAHIEAGSMINTPPVFAIFVCLLTLRWLKSLGGIGAIAAINQKKANLLYQTLDTIPLFIPTVAKEDRSLMNVVWICSEKNMDSELLIHAEREGIVGIQGHRTAGGFRASLYNAMPFESVKYLTDFLIAFANKKG